VTESHSERIDQTVGRRCWHNGQACCKSGRWVWRNWRHEIAGHGHVDQRKDHATREGTTVATAIGETMTSGSIKVAVTLARVASVACSYMSSSIGEIYGGHLLLKSHLMSQEKTVNVITRDGIYANSDVGNQGIKLRSKTGQQEGNSLKIIEGLATSSKGVTESFQLMEIIGDR